MQKLKVDLHTHTCEDPKDRISYNAYQLIDKASILKFDALAITNHDFVLYNDKLIRYAEKRNVLLLPGMELTLSKKHVLLINPDFQINPKGRSLSDLPKIKKKDNLIIAPHPFFPQSKSLKSEFHNYLPYFDAIEFSHCYNNLINKNKKALETAHRHNLPIIGTSDCHFLWEFGMTYAKLEAKKNILSIIEAVKKGRIELFTTPFSWFSMARLAVDMMGVNLKKLFTSTNSCKE